MASLLLEATYPCTDSQIQEIFFIIFGERVIQSISHESPFKCIIHVHPLNNTLLYDFVHQLSTQQHKLVMFQQGSFWKVSLYKPITFLWFSTSLKKTRIPYKIESIYS